MILWIKSLDKKRLAFSPFPTMLSNPLQDKLQVLGSFNMLVANAVNLVIRYLHMLSIKSKNLSFSKESYCFQQNFIQICSDFNLCIPLESQVLFQNFMQPDLLQVRGTLFKFVDEAYNFLTRL